jgi:hypothetical protein
VLEFPPLSEIFAPYTSFSVLEIRKIQRARLGESGGCGATVMLLLVKNCQVRAQYGLVHSHSGADICCSAIDQVATFENSPVDISKL